PLERVLGDGLGCWDAGAAARHRRHRGGVTFSRQTHLLLRLRADLPVSGEAVLLLPRLDLGYRTGADLPVHSRADDLLDGGVIEGAFMLHLVPAGDVPEVPALADALPLIPGPAIQEPIPLDPGLNLAGVDIDREAVLVVRAEVGGGDGDTAGLACPDRSRVGAVRRVLPAPADLGVVRL